MGMLTDQVLREFGNIGAETLKNYLDQIHYTAYWCIRMLREDEGIEAVLPETVDDLIVIRRGIYESFQVKTRREGQNLWTNAEVLHVFCKQYNGRKAFPDKEFNYIFVSNYPADNSKTFRNSGLGSLSRLKNLLAIKRDNQGYNVKDQSDMEQLEQVLIPQIQKLMHDNHNETVTPDQARLFLYSTTVETSNDILAEPEAKNIEELSIALQLINPGQPSYSYPQLKDIYDRLLMLIIRRIMTTTLNERHISTLDVLGCLIANQSMPNGYPDLDALPGRTKLEKKTLHGGFDQTEIPALARHQYGAESDRRRYINLGMQSQVDRLTVAIIDYQRHCRDKVCRVERVLDKPGPVILRMLEEKLPTLITKYLTKEFDIDESFCLGLIWRETNQCIAWWHNLEQQEADK